MERILCVQQWQPRAGPALQPDAGIDGTPAECRIYKVTDNKAARDDRLPAGNNTHGYLVNAEDVFRIAMIKQ